MDHVEVSVPTYTGNKMAADMLALHGPIKAHDDECPACGLLTPCPSRAFALAFIRDRFDELPSIAAYFPDEKDALAPLVTLTLAFRDASAAEVYQSASLAA